MAARRSLRLSLLAPAAESTHATKARSSTALSSGDRSTHPTSTTRSSSTAVTSQSATSRSATPNSESSSTSVTKASKRVLPETKADVPSTDYLPVGGTSWKIKAVLIFLFAFLIILLAALCYALFNFLTAAPEPNTRAPWIVTAEGDIDDSDESSTEEGTSPVNPVDPVSPAVTVPPVIRTTSSIGETTTTGDSMSTTTPQAHDEPSIDNLSSDFTTTSTTTTGTTLRTGLATPELNSTATKTSVSLTIISRRVVTGNNRTTTANIYVTTRPGTMAPGLSTPSTVINISTTLRSTTSRPASTTPATAPGIYPMGRAPLFCTYGVHRQDYDKINVDACDYAFIPFYVQGRDTFVDDSNPITQKLISAAVASTKTSFAISVPHANRSAVRQDLKRQAGKDRLRQYWTTKSIYHYAVFDIGVRPNESSHSERILKEAFDLLKMFRGLQEDLKVSEPGQLTSPRRGFVVASFYLWPSTQSPALVELGKNLRNFIVDGLIVLTHLTVDEHQAGLPCVITGGAPYEINITTNLLGMVNVMRHIQKQTEWNRNISMAISVSMCTRVYMPEKHADLDEKCVDHIRRPNSTAAFCNDPQSIYGGPTTVRCGHYTALSTSENTPPLVATFETNETVSEKYCKIKKNFADLSVGLAIFDVECEDWQGNCTDLNTPIPGTDRFRDIAAYVASVANVTGNQLPCK